MHVIGQGRIQKLLYREGGGGPSLIDILIDLYLLFTECFDSTLQVDTYFQRGRRFQVLVAMGSGKVMDVEVLISIPKET